MGKRKKRKSSKKGGLKVLLGFLSFTGSLLLRVVPFAVLFLAVGALFFGVKNALYADSNLLVQSIEVEPSSSLNPTLRENLESKLLGRNILKIDLDKLANDLELDSKIQKASVSRKLPFTIKIDIKERRPIGLLRFDPRGDYALISEDGMILDVLKTPTDSLILFEAFSSSVSKLQSGKQPNVRGFDQAVQFIKAVWESPLGSQEIITRISLDRLGSTSVTFGSGPPIRLGRNPHEKLAAVQKVIPVLDATGRGNIEYVDLQYDDVIIKRKI